MLQRIHIENYKCLRDVTVDLGDFTILIGPNDSGKSSFLEVVQSFGKLVRQGYAGLFGGDRTPANLVWRKDAGRHIVMEAAGISADHRFDYRLEIPIDQRPPRESLECDGDKLFWTEEVSASQPPPYNYAPGTRVVVLGKSKMNTVQPAQAGVVYLQQFVQQNPALSAAIAEAFTSSLEYQFDLDSLPRPSVPQPGIVLEPSGANLAAVLDLMQNSPDRSSFETLQKSLHEAIPTLRGIVLPPVPQPSVQGAKALEFILSGNGQPPVTIPASQASGGALLLTAFLTLAYTQTPGLLLFEEPENGLHPYRLRWVLDILRKMNRGEIGNRKRQIILTTHNPLLLNYANPEEVRVFVRHPEEGTKVIPMTQVPDIDRLLKEFALGELWYLLGEEKMFEEQPA
ncbi:MAG: AAA family ATPase [Gemmataceae bacterium]